MSDKDISHLDEATQVYIRSLRTEAQENRVKASQLATAVTERDTAVADALAKLTDRDQKLADSERIKTEYGTLRNEHDTLKDEHAQVLVTSGSTQLELDKVKAALDAGLPYSYAARLQGDSADAIKADALEFKKSLGGKDGAGRVAFDATAGGQTETTPKDSLRSFIAAQLDSNQE